MNEEFKIGDLVEFPSGARLFVVGVEPDNTDSYAMAMDKNDNPKYCGYTDLKRAGAKKALDDKRKIYVLSKNPKKCFPEHFREIRDREDVAMKEAGKFDTVAEYIFVRWLK